MRRRPVTLASGAWGEGAWLRGVGEGFVEEGRLRESVRVSIDGADGYDSLVVMSMLDREYQARVALGLEAAATAR